MQINPVSEPTGSAQSYLLFSLTSRAFPSCVLGENVFLAPETVVQCDGASSCGKAVAFTARACVLTTPSASVRASLSQIRNLKKSEVCTITHQQSPIGCMPCPSSGKSLTHNSGRNWIGRPRRKEEKSVANSFSHLRLFWPSSLTPVDSLGWGQA